MPRLFYSPGQEVIVQGVVVRTLEEVPPGPRSSERWVVALLKMLGRSDTIWARIAPRRVFPHLFRQGDTLWIRGCLEDLGGTKILLAREVRWRGGRKVLRDPTGFPLWMRGGEKP